MASLPHEDFAGVIRQIAAVQNPDGSLSPQVCIEGTKATYSTGAFAQALGTSATIRICLPG